MNKFLLLTSLTVIFATCANFSAFAEDNASQEQQIALAPIATQSDTQTNVGKDLQAQIEELRQIIAEQQKQINDLQAKVDSKPADKPKTDTTLTVASGTQASLYGFLRLDMGFDSSLMSNGQAPMWVLSPNDSRKRSLGNQQLEINPRLSRLGFNFTAPESIAPGAKITGKLEVDFFTVGQGSESSELLRLRHAYINIQKGSHTVLLGQTWDVISPLIPTVGNPTLMWNAGNLGDRRPQIRYAYAPKETPVNAMVSANITGTTDMKDGDTNTVRDGENSAWPNFQMRVGYKTKAISAGIWGHYGWEKLTNPVSPGPATYSTHSIGADWECKLASNWDFRGEVWQGNNLSDFRGGISQGVNTTLGKEIRSWGGWAEVGFQANKIYKVGVGYMLDDPKDADVAVNLSDITKTGRLSNQVWYVYNVWKINPAIQFGVDYMFWSTDHNGYAGGTNNRLAAYVQQNF